jgi:hypothetical protein
MRRILLVLLVGSLVLASPAAAKGPHVILWSGQEPIEPGTPWVATLELNEFQPHGYPVMIAKQGDRRERASVRAGGGGRFRTSLVFPTAGRWRIVVGAGVHSFRFGAIPVGADEPPKDYVAFPTGTEGATHGSSTIYSSEEPAIPAAAKPAPESAPEPADDGGGVPWLLPIAGVVLAGAGVAIRRRPRWRRRGSGGSRRPSPR